MTEIKLYQFRYTTMPRFDKGHYAYYLGEHFDEVKAVDEFYRNKPGFEIVDLSEVSIDMLTNGCIEILRTEEGQAERVTSHHQYNVISSEGEQLKEVEDNIFGFYLLKSEPKVDSFGKSIFAKTEKAFFWQKKQTIKDSTGRVISSIVAHAINNNGGYLEEEDMEKWKEAKIREFQENPTWEEVE